MHKISVKKVSIIIPVFNSSKTISLLVDEILKEIKMYKELEIVLVNDGSHLDNSSEVCESIAYKNPTVKFINLSRNFGEHNAVLAGLNYCTGDCAVIMDDDFENPPKDVCKLVDEIIKEPLGGAHRNREKTFMIVREAILNAYNEFKNTSSSELVKKRMNKYSNMGIYKS